MSHNIKIIDILIHFKKGFGLALISVLSLAIILLAAMGCAAGDIDEALYLPVVLPNTDGSGSLGSSDHYYEDAYINNINGIPVSQYTGTRSETLYLDDSASDIMGYYQLLTTANTAIPEEEDSGISNGTEVLIESYVTEVDVPGTTVIPSGVWQLRVWARTDGGNFSRLVGRIYIRTALGVETEIASMTSPILTTTYPITPYVLPYVALDYTVDPTDRIVLKMYAYVTVGTRTVYYTHNGTARYSRLIAPFPIIADGSGIGITWMGVYNGGTNYVVNDAVSYLGSSYICIADSVGNLPTNPAFWDLMASKGDTGAAGADGADSNVLIYENTMVGDTSGWTINNIPGTYKHLYMQLQVRSDASSGNVYAYMRFNNDNGGNYAYSYTIGNAAGSTASSGSVNTTSTYLIQVPYAALPSTSHFATGSYDIPFYTVTDAQHTYNGQGYFRTSNTSGTAWSMTCAGSWYDTSAITRIDIFPSDAGNFKAGSKITLYGLE